MLEKEQEANKQLVEKLSIDIANLETLSTRVESLIDSVARLEPDA